jgi:hypothetical protein
MGYPVSGEDVVGSGAGVPADQSVHWTHFEHGVIASVGGAALVAPSAVVDRARLVDALRRRIDAQLVERDIDLGPFSITVRPGLYGVDVLGVDGWSEDFWAATPRVLRVKVSGFVSVPVWRDPTFQVDLALRFGCRWPDSFTAPTTKTLVATLAGSPIVRAQGIASGTVANAVMEGILAAFAPHPSRPYITDASLAIADIPTGVSEVPGKVNVDFLDAMLLRDGSLALFVNPLPDLAGRLRRFVAQRTVDALLGEG